MSTLRIAVVIPAFNAEQTLEACVGSVLAGHRVPEHVVIVDDASTDGTLRLGRTLAQAHAGRVECVAVGRNRGPATARNTGVRSVNADAYFFLDADTELGVDALAGFEVRLAECDAVSGIYDPEPLNTGAVPRYKALMDHFNFARAGVVAYDGFMGACGGVRAQAFAAVRGFDESLRAGDAFENEEFGYRLTAGGYRNLIDPEVRARHHFPGFRELTRTYFKRVSQWVELFGERRRFESAGDATARTGLATLSVPLMLASVPLAVVVPIASGVTLVLASIWLRGYGPFFMQVARDSPRRLPSCIALNLWFSTIISAGAVHGAFASLRSTLTGGDAPATPADQGGGDA